MDQNELREYLLQGYKPARQKTDWLYLAQQVCLMTGTVICLGALSLLVYTVS